MPRSKRNKEVALTSVKKVTKERKDAMAENVRKAVEECAYVYLIECENQRNQYLKECRAKFWKSGGRIFFGKNKLIQMALGTEASTECADGIHLLSQELRGETGLLCCNESPEEVKKMFEEYQPSDFARSGCIATETVILDQGSESLSHLAHSIEAHLRTLGLPTKLEKGKIVVLGDHTVCEEGKPLTVDQAQILKLLDTKMTKFKIKPTGRWTKKDGSFIVL